MKAHLLFTGTGPLVILTSYESITNPELVEKIAAKGITKFIACEIPLESVKARYGHHFELVRNDLRETDDLRVLDYDGHRAFTKFPFNELGSPVYYEPK